LEENAKRVSKMVRPTLDVRSRTIYYRFYLIKPKYNMDLQEISMRIMNFKEVAEVYLTEGKTGILVKTKFFDDSKPSQIEEFLKKIIPIKYGILVSPIQYKRVFSKPNTKNNRLKIKVTTKVSMRNHMNLAKLN